MTLLKFDLTVSTKGRIRRFGAVRENSKGDVYLSFFAVLAGEEGQRSQIKEQRISLHPSWRSENFSTIKFQLHTADGRLIENSNHTAATRQIHECRFAPVFALGLTTLEDPIYDRKVKSGIREGFFCDFDPEETWLTLVVFVGSPHIPFPLECQRACSRYFQILFFMTTYPFAATDLGIGIRFQHGWVDHRRAGHEEFAAAKLELVRGLLPSDAVNLADLLHRRLAVVQLRKYRRLIGDTENIPYEEMLAKEAGTLAQALPANIGRLYWPIENESTAP